MNKSYTPLIDSIESYLKHEKFRAHTPGHRGGKNISKKLKSLDAFNWDITEVEGVGNLFIEEGPIYQSEINTASIYNSKRTLFFTQGATSAIFTALLALSSKKNKILVPRNAHASVVNGLLLADLEPVWYMPSINNNGLYNPFDADEIISISRNNKDADILLVQNPTYEGFTGDIQLIKKYCEQNAITLIVDEAHGSHWIASDEFPLSATELECDLVIQSPHKTLPSFTGAAYLHINDESLINSCVNARKVIHSTSPSFLTLASLDSLNYYLTFEAKEKYKELSKVSREIVSFIDSLNNVILINSDSNMDFTKINIKFSVNKQKVSDIFLKYGIIIEKWSSNNVLILLTPSITKKEIDCLKSALYEINEIEDSMVTTENYEILELPKRIIPLKEASFSETELVRIEDSVGRICASVIMEMPPGIPLIIPGEEINLKLSKKIQKRSNESNLSGIVISNEQKYISVVKYNS